MVELAPVKAPPNSFKPLAPPQTRLCKLSDL